MPYLSHVNSAIFVTGRQLYMALFGKSAKIRYSLDMRKVDSFTDQVIKAIETARVESGLSAAELIVKSGITRRTYFRKMRGDTSFTTEDIDALAKAMGVDPFLILSSAAERADAANRTDIDLSQLPDDEKVAYVLNKIKAGDQTLAAMNDPNKEKEAEGGDGR